MNKTTTIILALLALCLASAMAVPSGINYQGALTDDQGNPITGTRTMSIKLYGAATGGTQLYTEDIGTVDVSDGVFSFEFGTGGTSNAEQSDTVAITDGTATTFQKVLSSSSVVAGSVSITDGTYTWSQSGGSSNEDDFWVAYSTGLRRVTVNYYNGAPAAGRTITATYRTPTSGISGALAGNNQPWAEITVDGVAQVPRQKVLTVPFALKAFSVDLAALNRSIEKTIEVATVDRDDMNFYTSLQTSPRSHLPLATSWPSQSDWFGKGSWSIPSYVKKVKSISLEYQTYGGKVYISISKGATTLYEFEPPVSTNKVKLALPVDLPLDFSSEYRVNMSCYPTQHLGGAAIFTLSLQGDVSITTAW
jgi:hypothetical protein